MIHKTFTVGLGHHPDIVRLLLSPPGYPARGTILGFSDRDVLVNARRFLLVGILLPIYDFINSRMVVSRRILLGFHHFSNRTFIDHSTAAHAAEGLQTCDGPHRSSRHP